MQLLLVLCGILLSTFNSIAGMLDAAKGDGKGTIGIVCVNPQGKQVTLELDHLENLNDTAKRDLEACMDEVQTARNESSDDMDNSQIFGTYSTVRESVEKLIGKDSSCKR